MSSIRRLKKDIDYLTYSVVADCFNYSVMSGKNEDEISEIVQNIINTRNELRNRVNAGRQLPKAEKQPHFKAVFKDLMISADGAFSKLSELVKQD